MLLFHYEPAGVAAAEIIKQVPSKQLAVELA